MTEQVDYAKEPEVTLGWRIQIALDEGGLKHKDLMEHFEVSRDTVSRWCRNIGAPPKKFIQNEIAVMCGVSSRWLMDGPGTSNRGPDDGGNGARPKGFEPPTFCGGVQAGGTLITVEFGDLDRASAASAA